MAVKTVNVKLDGKVTTLMLNASTKLYEATLTDKSIMATDDTGNQERAHTNERMDTT